MAATIAQTFVDAWNALSATEYPEFAEITASRSGDDVILTADVAGRPFTATLTPLEANLSAADAQTIEGVGTATTGATTTTSTGPNDWSTAGNWSDGAVPVDSDIVFIEDSDDEILYGLSQTSIDLTALHILASFTGKIGLPKWNPNGYAEYRTEFLSLGTATTLKIGYGPGAGSGALKISVGSNACTCDVNRTAPTVEEGVPSLLWKGTHANNVLNVNRGFVGVATFAGETATIATLRVGYVASRERDSQVVCGSGVTLTTIEQTGGQLEVESNVTTAKVRGGALTVKGSATVTTLNAGIPNQKEPNLIRATCYYNTSGTLTTANLYPGAVLDLEQDNRARTITTLNVFRLTKVNNRLGNAVITTLSPAGGATPVEFELNF